MPSTRLKCVRLHLRLDCFYYYYLSSMFFSIFLLFSHSLFFYVFYMTSSTISFAVVFDLRTENSGRKRKKKRNMQKRMTFTCSNKFGDFVRKFNASRAFNESSKLCIDTIFRFSLFCLSLHSFILFHFIFVFFSDIAVHTVEFPLQKQNNKI